MKRALRCTIVSFVFAFGLGAAADTTNETENIPPRDKSSSFFAMSNAQMWDLLEPHGGVAVMAVLVRSEFPSENKDQIRHRLLSAGKFWPYGNSSQGYGAIDAYKAVGGLVKLGITFSGSTRPNEVYTLTAVPEGVGPFDYTWVANGAVISTASTVTRVNGAAGTTQMTTATVRDRRDGKSITQSHTHTVEAPVGCSGSYYCECTGTCESSSTACRRKCVE